MCRRNEIDLCARLLGVAAIGLNHNPGLIFFVLVTKLALVILTLPMIGLMFASYTNGHVVPNSKSLCHPSHLTFSDTGYPFLKQDQERQS